ncbi:MAG: riboflavin synthase [Deltaproteobacteria bacterium]|nr:riboflavin synthase [Deltaproteobacteria bacterium]
MFTGLIEDVGEIRAVRRQAGGLVLTVRTALPLSEIRLGDSVAVNGVCLTVTALHEDAFDADVSPETRSCTTFDELVVHTPVNLERALRLGDRLGGHLVYGHVDGVARLASRHTDGNAIRMAFQLAPSLGRYLVPKGSVAIDGISLTVNTVSPDGFAIAVIPHTLEKTTLRQRKIGDRVNIEVDIFARFAERLLAGADESAPVREKTPAGSPLTEAFLAGHGFL